MLTTVPLCALGCAACREPCSCPCECHGPRDPDRVRRAVIERRVRDDAAAAQLAAYERGPP